MNGLGECKICYKEKIFVNNIIVPCGHNGYCIKCLTILK